MIYLNLPEEPEPVAITNLFDEEGNDVDEWHDAHSVVAGPLANGAWMSALCEDYIARPLN